MRLLELVQLEGFAQRYPSQLSGGQRQRVALARALAIEPRVLLLDEPFGALDAKVRKELRRWLRRLHDEMGLTSVFVTHDQEEALELADRVVVMSHGRIEQVGTPDEVYDRPATPFVYEFLGHVNRLPCTVARGRARVWHQEFGVDEPTRSRSSSSGAGQAYVRPEDIEIVAKAARRGGDGGRGGGARTPGPGGRGGGGGPGAGRAGRGGGAPGPPPGGGAAPRARGPGPRALRQGVHRRRLTAAAERDDIREATAMARDGCRIAVIGAGFSGVMTAIHLLWRCQPGERVYLVERGDRVGPGLAYGTSHPRHLVNVRAENMSAFADEPDHFVRWLERLPRAARPTRASGPSPAPSSAARCSAPTSRSCCARRSPARTVPTTSTWSPTRRSRSGRPTAASCSRPANGRATRSTPRSWRWATCRRRGRPCRATSPTLAAEATAPLEPGLPVVLLWAPG